MFGIFALAPESRPAHWLQIWDKWSVCVAKIYWTWNYLECASPHIFWVGNGTKFEMSKTSWFIWLQHGNQKMLQRIATWYLLKEGYLWAKERLTNSMNEPWPWPTSRAAGVAFTLPRSISCFIQPMISNQESRLLVDGTSHACKNVSQPLKCIGYWHIQHSRY